MTDRLTSRQRSQNMSRIKGSGTKPELLVRAYLDELHIKYRCNTSDLGGRPDIALDSIRTVIFVHGCFWHRHAGCSFATTPSTNVEFWQQKFEGNVARDKRTARQLAENGWHVHTLWACQLGSWGSLDQLGLELLAVLD